MEPDGIDETSAFFLRDTVHRLSRLSEQALGYGIFALLLYCRLAYPGGAGWRIQCRTKPSMTLTTQGI
eukprot:s766_g12.t1